MLQHKCSLKQWQAFFCRENVMLIAGFTIDEPFLKFLLQVFSFRCRLSIFFEEKNLGSRHIVMFHGKDPRTAECIPSHSIVI